MSRREDVADLREGDVVELFRNSWPDGTVVRGALYEASGWLYVAEEAVRGDDGRPVLGASYTLTVISRVPRPFYVNHPRTNPRPGDVVRDADGDNKYRVWVRDTRPPRWTWADHPAEDAGDLANVRLRLLVDGETGQVVP